jgi:Bacterial PH domain
MSDDMRGAAGVSIRAALEDDDDTRPGPELEAEAEDTPPVSWHGITADAGEKRRSYAMEDTAPDVPRAVKRYLMGDEADIIAVQFHRGLLLAPALAVTAGLALAIAANTALYAAHRAGILPVRLIWFAYLAASVWAAWRWLEWRQTWFVITGHRVLLVRTTHLIGRGVTMLPVDKMRDVKLIVPPVGRILGYGTLDFASIGTERALDAVRFLPYPDWLYRECCALVMPDTDRRPVKVRRGPLAGKAPS